MEIRYFQKGFNFSEDGPGNRLVIHLSGCNLHCPWCSNPEGMSASGGSCTTVDALFTEILSCKRLFFDGGGVTFTGGECTLQRAPLAELLRLCRANGIHTAIETNGTMPYDGAFFEKVDFIIADFKHYDEDVLAKTVGNVSGYRDNLRAYIGSGKKTLIRTVLIRGFNAEREDAEHFARFFSELDTSNASFEFLPYHEYGKSKWLSLGREYTVKDAHVTPETVAYFEETFHKYNLKTIRS